MNREAGAGEYEMPSPTTRPEDDPYSVGREERLPAQAGGGLLPCPFCGSPPEVKCIEAHTHYLVNLPAVGDTWVLECTGCPAGFCSHTEAGVIESWNRRTA